MLWLLALLLACVLAAWAAWSRGLPTLAAVMVVPVFVLLFLVGRRIEARWDSDWASAARAVGGTFQAAGAPTCASFGRPVPWDEWARHGQLQCGRAIQGDAAQPPFALLQVRYSVRDGRGEEHPDAWYEVAVAALRLAPASIEGLQPVPAPEGYAAVRNAQALFVWKKGSRGAGEPLAASALPALLEEARRVAAPLRR